MKKLIIIMLLSMFGYAQAQSIVFSEDFESLPFDLTSSGTTNIWAQNSDFAFSGSNSDSVSIVNNGDTVYLSSNAFSTSGKSKVLLEFKHICKLSSFDGGYIEVSSNNGASWTRLTFASYLGYGQFSNIGNKFNATSYAVDWDASVNNAVPTNSWWKGEVFDLSSLLGNKAQAKIRFVIADGDNNGAQNNYGWLLDDIKVTADAADLIPPKITYVPPLPLDSTYSTGPYDIHGYITDASGISAAYVVYTVNGVLDTVPMNFISFNVYKGTIPSFSYGDTVCYHIVAVDSSVNFNIGRNPIASCKSFVIKRDPSLPVPLQYDAKLETLVSPIQMNPSNVQTPITIRISNKGDSLLTKVGVGLKIDGQMQPSYSWTGALGLDQVSDTFSIGSEVFQQGEHNVTTWTYSPNDTIDQDKSNDTIDFSFFVCNGIMNGSYTLGGPSADFQNFNELIQALKHCGINGPTTVYVNPGIYTNQIKFTTDIVGLDTTNTLTIRSASSNVNDVKLKFAPTSNDNYVVKFDNVKGITIKGITIESKGAYYSTVISMRNYAEYNAIDSCRLIAPVGQLTEANVINVKDPSVNYNKFLNNTMYGGVYGINIQGSSIGFQDGNIIRNNTIEACYSMSINAIRQNDIIIENNHTIRNYMPNAPTYTGGIRLLTANNYSVMNNVIETNITYSGYGISIGQTTVSASGGFGRIINNSIIVDGSSNGSINGLYLYNNVDAKVFYNTISLNAGSSLAAALYIGGLASTIDIRNNVFVNYGGGYAMRNGVTTLTSVDYNCYYSIGINIVRWGSNYTQTNLGINGIRSLTGLDAHSIVAEPKFYSTHNLHSYSSDLDSAAVVISGITTDFEGDIRNATHPDIGADEFIIPTTNTGVVEVLNLLPVDTQNRVVNLEAVIMNYGSGNLTSMSVNYSLNGGSVVSKPWTGSLASGQKDTIALGSFTVPVLDYQLKVYTVLAADTLKNNDTLFGAYYGLPLVDLEPLVMISPMDGCSKGANETISIQYVNHGVDDVLNGVTASYRLVGGSYINEIITDTIGAGDTLVYTFTHTADLSVGYNDSTFNFEFVVHHNNDAIHESDTLLQSMVSKADLIPPYVDDTTITYGSSITLVAVSNDPVFWYPNDSTNTQLADGLTYQTPILFDTTEYYVQASRFIPSSQAIIGMSSSQAGAFDKTIYGKTQGYGKYQILFTAAELSASGLVAGEIESIAFHVGYQNGNFGLSDFNVSVANVSNTSLGSTYLTPSFTNVHSAAFSGVKQSDQWYTHNFTSSFQWDGVSSLLIQICTQGSNYNAPKTYYTSTTKTMYVASTGANSNCAAVSGTTSLKRPNIRIKTKGSQGCVSSRVPVLVSVPLPPIDANLAAIVNPVDGCGLVSTPVQISIVNNGTDTIPSGFTATYRVDNNAYVSSETITTAIAPADTLLYTFNTLASLVPGANGQNYKITAKVSVPNDVYSANDSLLVDSIFSNYTPSNPVTTNFDINYADSASLTAVAVDSIYWYLDSLGSNFLGAGNGYNTDPLYDTTVFYVKEQRSKANANYVIGTSNLVSSANGPSPYGANNNGSKMQFLIKASELTAMGMQKGPIYSISFNVVSSQAYPMSNYTISLANTNRNSMMGTTLETGLSQVYSSNSYIETTGWNEHKFTTPFYWDGVSNLIIETCFKNSSTTPFSTVKYTTTADYSVGFNTGGNSFSCSDSTLLTNSKKRPNMKLNQTGLATCASDLIPLTVNVINYPATDAGITAIVEPSGNISSVTPTSVKVVLKNFGTNPITTASIKWTENGVSQTTYNWTGNLSHAQTDTITIDAAHLFKGGSTDIEVWTELNNDTIHSNDTTVISQVICMSGTYSINTQSGDYHSFSEAISDLILAGVCGPVVISADSGTYTEQVVLYPVTGASAINTITFQSSMQDSSQVKISYSTNLSKAYVFKIVGASNIIIKNLGIESSALNYAHAIVLGNGANNIEIRNNSLQTSNATALYTKSSAIYAHAQDINQIVIANNKFNFGMYVIDFAGTSSNKVTNVSIVDNVFDGFNGRGVMINMATNIEIKSNKIVSGFDGKASYGAYLYYVNNFDVSKNKISIISSSTAKGIKVTGSGGTTTNPSMLYNNFVSVGGGLNNNKGIVFYSSDYVNCEFNSVNIFQGSAYSRAAEFSSSQNMVVRNNSFVAETGYAFYVTPATSNSSFDYNNIYTNPSYSTHYAYWGTPVSDLAVLKSLNANQNQHCIDVQADYFSLTNLHTKRIDFYQAGTANTTITVDIDDDSRNATAPCIGADEFAPPAIDLSLTNLVYPFQSDCGYSSTDSIVVRVLNMGLNAIDFSALNAVVTMYINGVVTDTIHYTISSGILQSGQDTNVYLSNSYDLSTYGSYSFAAEISITNDGDSLNDAMPSMSITAYPNINSFPFSEGFESGLNVSFKEISGTQSSVGASTLAGNGSSMGLHFQGGTNSSWTTPANVAQAFNNHSHVSVAQSCNIDASSVSTLFLQFNLRQTKNSTTNYGNNSSWFRVLLIDANSVTHYLKNLQGDSVFKPNTPNYDPFVRQTFDISAYAGQNFQISFEAAMNTYYSYGTYDGDNAYVDDIELWEPVPKDIAVKAVWSDHYYGKPTTSKTINIKFSNMGTTTITSIPFAYQADNGVIVRDTAIGSFLPYATDTFTFSTNYSLTNGVQNICAFVELNGDGEPTNDTACAIYNGLNTYTATYSDDFESLDDWFTESSNVQWQLGTPNSTKFTHAHSGQNAWTTVLAGNHSVGSVDYLYTPYLIVPAYADTALLEFWMTMNVNIQNAYAILEYSFDGVLWTSLGYIAATNSENWYNHAITGMHVWSLSNYDWARSSIQLDPTVFNTGTPFQMRFVFSAGSASISYDGWAIDDFKVSIPPAQTDVGVNAILSPVTSTITGDVVSVSVDIKNYGLDTITSFPLEYSIDGTPVATQQWTGTLYPGSVESFTFNTTYIAKGSNYDLCAYTKLSNDMVLFNDTICKTIIAAPGKQDAGISAVIAPSGQSSIGKPTSVKATVVNYGSDTLFSIPVKYMLNSIIMASETFNGVIAPGDSVEYTFTTTYISGVGAYSICVYTELANDVDATNDQECVVVVGTSIENLDGSSFELGQNHPNPASESTTIEFYLPKPGKVQFRLVNSLGAIVEQKDLNYSAGKQQLLIDVKSFKSGVYHYSLSFDGEIKTFKLVVIH